MEVRKKDVACELIKKAPGTPGIDFVTKNRLNKLKDRTDSGNNNSSSQ